MNQKISELLAGKETDYIFPFFWLRGEKEETLKEYMQVIHDCGIRAVCLESRPHPDFCGPGWWHDLDVILAEAKRLNMKLWILDDSHFPTGYCNGAFHEKIAQGDYSLLRQSVTYRILGECRDGEEICFSPDDVKNPGEPVLTKADRYFMKEYKPFPDEILLDIAAVKTKTEEVRTVSLLRAGANETGRTETQKAEAETAEARKEEAERTETQRAEARKEEAERTETQRAEAETAEARKEEAERTETQKAEDSEKEIRKSGDKEAEAEKRKPAEIRWKSEPGKWKIYGLYLTRNRGPHRDYMNMLSLPSCQVLLKSVYEPHWEHYREEFGKTILGFFSDEPEIGNGHIYQQDKRLNEVEDLPWSEELQECLQKKWGEDWTKKLPYLWEEGSDPKATADIRVCYMDQVTRLVEKDFSKQIGNWCRDHGVMYIGHLIEDHNQHVRCGSSLGHYFRGLSGQDMAGIDDIGGQVLPQGEDLDIRTKWQDHRDGVFYHFALGKLAGSAASIDPLKKGRSMCEIFGNYGWEEGVCLEKYLADHFMVRGINHFVPHAFSAAAFPDPDCPPHFYAHGNNPQYRHFGKLMSYMERICHLISDGRQVVHAAILYFAESDWSGGRNQPGEVPGRILAEHQIDYHFIPSDVFTDEKYGAVIDRENHLLRVNEMEYRLFIIPETDYLTPETRKVVSEMKDAGVKVIFMNDISAEELSRRCEASVYGQLSCFPPSSQIRCLHYLGEDYELYYAVNEGAEPWKGKVGFCNLQKPYSAVYRYDAWENRCYEVQLTADHRLSEPVSWEPEKGYLYLFDRTGEALEMRQEEQQAMRGKPGEGPMILKNWERSVCRALEYPHFHNPVSVMIPDYPEAEDPSFGGFVRYRSSIAFEKKPDCPVFLEIDGKQEGIELFVNGVSAGIQIVPVYRFEISSLLHEGENEFIIEKATTLERVIPKRDKAGNLLRQPDNRCGIDGEIRLVM